MPFLNPDPNAPREEFEDRPYDEAAGRKGRKKLLELDRRLRSRRWRLNNLYWIEGETADGTRKVMRFHFNWAQEKFYATLWWLCCILKVRQLGFSTMIAIFGLDDVLFNENHKFGIVDKTDNDAKKKLAKCKFAYENLNRPDPDRPDLVKLGAAIKAARPLVPPTNEHTMTFGGSQNGAIWAGTSFRGDTAQILHVSELGYTSHYYPRKAEELMAGATNAVHKGNHIFVESTFEGGKVGEFYNLIMNGLDNQDKTFDEMTMLDYRLYFFTWYKHPEYQLPGADIPQLDKHEIEYYAKVRKQGIILTKAQVAWHIRKWRANRDNMMKEFPTTIEDCLNAQVKGAIYGQETMRARERGRVTDVGIDHRYGCFTSWDLGFGDFMAIWVGQVVGTQIRWLGYYENHREQLSTYIQWLQKFQEDNGTTINMHYVPHDADAHDKAGRTFKQALAEHGVTNVCVVPRTPDVWVGINTVRSLFDSMWFDRSTEYDWNKLGTRYIGGFYSLEAYAQAEDAASGAIRPVPIHNQACHGADALRTFAEAYAKGMFTTDVSGPPRGPHSIGKTPVVQNGPDATMPKAGRMKVPTVVR